MRGIFGQYDFDAPQPAVSSHLSRSRRFFVEQANAAPAPTPSPHHRDPRQQNTFDPMIKPGNALAGRKYIQNLIQSVSEGLNPDSIDFSQINLHGADLTNLHGISKIGPKALSQINFAGADLSGLTFMGPMRGFYAPGAKLHGTQFIGAEMREANLEGAKLDKTSFSGGTSLAGANMTGVNGSVVMNNVDLGGVTLAGAKLEGSAHNVNFDGVRARGIHMASLHISGPKTSFKEAELDDAKISPQQHRLLSAKETGLASLQAPKIVEPGKHNSAPGVMGLIAQAPSPFNAA